MKRTWADLTQSERAAMVMLVDASAAVAAMADDDYRLFEHRQRSDLLKQHIDRLESRGLDVFALAEDARAYADSLGK